MSLWGPKNNIKTEDIRILKADNNHIDFVAPAVKKGNKELLNSVNKEIMAMKKDGRLKDIFYKHVEPVINREDLDTLLIDEV